MRRISYRSLTRVYPRACGGTAVGAGNMKPSAGLSPRLRGNRCPRHSCRPAARSIPAPAGEPAARPSPGTARRVYPRACGGTSSRASRATSARGLSPRLRGNLFVAVAAANPTWSIPAPAGEPNVCRATSAVVMVYPRACGGTYQRIHPAGDVEGLSPRLRGNLFPVIQNGSECRSIPAPGFLMRTG